MTSDTKRPTAQDIENARKLVGATVENVARACIDMGDPKILINSVSRWRPVIRALDYAADCLRAEEEAERVPEVDPDSGQSVVDLTWEGLWLVSEEGDEVSRGYGYALTTGHWGYYKGGGRYITKSGVTPNEAAARIAVEALLPPHCKVTNPETPQQAVPEQPPTDPEARVRAMSDEEVEAALTERGVGGWRGGVRATADDVLAMIDPDGRCWLHEERCWDRTMGDTTTESGRAECSRRLLVHLLRDEG